MNHEKLDMKMNGKDQAFITNTSNKQESEKPLIVLKQNYVLVCFVFSLVVILTIYLMLGVIMPVIKAGSFTAAWPTEKRMGRMILLFYLSWPLLMLWPFFLSILLRIGTYYFYNDRLVFEPIAIRRKMLIPYTQMYVLQYGHRGILITKEKMPEWSHPIKRLKIQYLQALGLGSFNFHENKIAGIQISKGLWLNPSEGPKAIQLLRERAFSVIEKNN